MTDRAIIATRTQSSSNTLGEPVYTEAARTIAGLLTVRAISRWRDLGLGTDVEAVFLTADPCEDLVPPATLTAGGKVYRNVTRSRRASLMGDGLTRLLLRAEAT